MPVVSVIIPAYNAAPFVGQAIESALGQRGVDLEVIVVDDESTDGTWRVLESFGPSIRKVRQDNGGPARARNRGAQLALGEWLAFLDADDEWLPGKLARQLEVAGERAGLVYSDHLIVLGSSREPEGRLSDSVRLRHGDVFEQLLEENFISLSTVLIRKRYFDQLGGFDPSRVLVGVEDWDLWLRYAAEIGPVDLCPEPTSRYRVCAGSLSSSSRRMLEGRLAVIRRALASPRGRGVTGGLIRRSLARAWEWSAEGAARERRPRAIGWYLRAAWYRPWGLGPYKGIIKCCLGRV